MTGGITLGFFDRFRKDKELTEDALRVKFIANDKKFNNVAITKDKDDITYKQILDTQSGSMFDTNAISQFRSLSSDREERYKEYESMLTDATIAAAIEMYADDATQYDYRTGKVIWAESNDKTINAAANRLIDVLGINEKAWSLIYSLCTYGDVYLRLYREGDESDYADIYANGESSVLSVRVKPKDDSRRIEEYIEYVDDPATIYDLQIRDKTSGFIRMSKSNDGVTTDDKLFSKVFGAKTVNREDVNMYDRTSFIHICLAGNIDRNPEIISIEENGKQTYYKVKTGKSILADAYEASQTVKLLEDSMMLSRLTKSAIIRIIQVIMGDMPKNEVNGRMQRLKQLIEQKLAFNKNNDTIASYNSPAPMENFIYNPVYANDIGRISADTLGGDVNIKDIVDIDYFNNKKLSALKIPKQYLNYDAPEGLGNGTSLTKLSSRYAHTVMRIQKAFIDGITNLLNLIFLDKGLDYIDEFTIKMVSPSTLEDAERDEQMQSRLDQSGSIMDLISERVTEKGAAETIDWILREYLKLSDVADIVSDNKVGSQDPNKSADFDYDRGGGGGPSISNNFDSGFDSGFEPPVESETSFETETEEPTMTPEA